MENKQTEIEQAKAILKQHGYYVGNLWTIQDVTDSYDCTDEQAQEFLIRH
jgi:ABC-type transport system substrate-binding protein